VQGDVVHGRRTAFGVRDDRVVFLQEHALRAAMAIPGDERALVIIAAVDLPDDFARDVA
jgi:hypothetical protein